jgi:hypothetical protein
VGCIELQQAWILIGRGLGCRWPGGRNCKIAGQQSPKCGATSGKVNPVFSKLSRLTRVISSSDRTVASEPAVGGSSDALSRRECAQWETRAATGLATRRFRRIVSDHQLIAFIFPGPGYRYDRGPWRLRFRDCGLHIVKHAAPVFSRIVLGGFGYCDEFVFPGVEGVPLTI